HRNGCGQERGPVPRRLRRAQQVPRQLRASARSCPGTVDGEGRNAPLRARPREPRPESAARAAQFPHRLPGIRLFGVERVRGDRVRYSTISKIGGFTALNGAAPDHWEMRPNACTGGDDADLRTTVE